MARVWMPIYWADYQKKTNHLSTIEHGAYLLLIAHYWVNGSLPDDDRKLSRIARMNVDDWAEIRETIKEFFYDGWKHKRIEEEFSVADANSDAAREKARRRWDKKKADAKAMLQHMPQHSPGNATAMPPDMLGICPSPSPTPISNTNVLDNSREASPLEILSECLSEKTASDLIEHRQKLNKPLTARAARSLAKKLQAYGNAEAAAEEMFVRGWSGFDSEWMANKSRAGPAKKASIVDINAEIKAELNGEYYGQNQQSHSSSSENDIEYLPLQAYADIGTR